MAQREGAALPPVSNQGDGDGESMQFPPFFSMCQPLRSVSDSNSWDAVCAPAVKAPDHMSDVDLMDGEHMKLSPQSPEKKQPHHGSMSDSLDEESKLHSSPTVANELELVVFEQKVEQTMDMDILDGETKQHSSSPSSKQHSSNTGSEPWGVEDKQLSMPFSFNRQPQSVGAGLWNMGNTCFLNATLQCITHTVPLLMKLRSSDHSTPCLYDKDGFCSFCALKEHIDESIRRSGSVLMPTRFRDNLNKISSDFRPGQQEDAHEFLRCLLDNLDKCTLDPESKGKPSSFDEDSIVKQVFGGRLRSQLSCCECGHCSETFEPFLDLSLEIDQVDHLVDALESFTKVEQIGDSDNKLTCEGCNGRVSKHKQLKLDKSPVVIAFQLKRFTTLDHSVEKIDKHVVYPSELDLRPFHSKTDDKGELKYHLYGVVEHSGLPNYGHYVCTIRSSPSSWHLMNDSHVTSITETDALNQEAYLLFYVKQDKSQWFSTLLKKTLHVENTTGASPVSVLENIDRNSPTSSGEGSNSSGDKLEKDVWSPCRTSFLRDDDAAERCTRYSFDSTTLERPSTPPPCHKRSLSDNHHSAFEFECFDDEDDHNTHLIPKAKDEPKRNITKTTAASKSLKDPCLDKNAKRLLRSMKGSRRTGLLNCLLTQRDVEQESRRCPQSEPVDKKKRKLSIAVLQH